MKFITFALEMTNRTASPGHFLSLSLFAWSRGQRRCDHMDWMEKQNDQRPFAWQILAHNNQRVWSRSWKIRVSKCFSMKKIMSSRWPQKHLRRPCPARPGTAQTQGRPDSFLGRIYLLQIGWSCQYSLGMCRNSFLFAPQTGESAEPTRGPTLKLSSLCSQGTGRRRKPFGSRIPSWL